MMDLIWTWNLMSQNDWYKARLFLSETLNYCINVKMIIGMCEIGIYFCSNFDKFVEET